MKVQNGIKPVLSFDLLIVKCEKMTQSLFLLNRMNICSIFYNFIKNKYSNQRLHD